MFVQDVGDFHEPPIVSLLAPDILEATLLLQVPWDKLSEDVRAVVGPLLPAYPPE